MTATSYSTEEQARRMGLAEAARLTSRGYPTRLVRVERQIQTICTLDGQSPSEMGYVGIKETRWIAILE